MGEMDEGLTVDGGVDSAGMVQTDERAGFGAKRPAGSCVEDENWYFLAFCYSFEVQILRKAHAKGAHEMVFQLC
jgi:hypothetical protein